MEDVVHSNNISVVGIYIYLFQFCYNIYNTAAAALVIGALGVLNKLYFSFKILPVRDIFSVSTPRISSYIDYSIIMFVHIK